MQKKFLVFYNISPLVKSTHLVLQTTSFNPFSSPIPTTWHFDKFAFEPKNDENKDILFTNYFIELTFLKKKTVSIA